MLRPFLRPKFILRMLTYIQYYSILGSTRLFLSQSVHSNGPLTASVLYELGLVAYRILEKGIFQPIQYCNLYKSSYGT